MQKTEIASIDIDGIYDALMSTKTKYTRRLINQWASILQVELDELNLWSDIWHLRSCVRKRLDRSMRGKLGVGAICVWWDANRAPYKGEIMSIDEDTIEVHWAK